MAGFWQKAFGRPNWEAEEQNTARLDGVAFPHCDALILHSPGVCAACDEFPEWQHYREGAGIAFSDADPLEVRDQGLAPCPSIFHRPSVVRDAWPANRPVPA